MVAIREALVVEGKYDAIRLSALLDTVIVETAGFGIFSSPKQRRLLERLAQERGLVVLTDSDAAGFLIRDYLTGLFPGAQIKQAYIPPIRGKERRKARESKEGLLGVEGMTDEVILKALHCAGATFLGEDDPAPRPSFLNKQRLYADGLSGRPESAARRRRLLSLLELPEHLSANRMIAVLNILLTEDDYRRLLAALSNDG